MSIEGLNLDKQLLDKINKFAPIKHILKNKTDNDDQVSHHFVDSLTLNIEDPIKEIMTDSRNKYHENEILEDIKDLIINKS